MRVCPQSLRSLLMPLLLLGALLQLTAAKAAKEDPNDCEGERRLCVHAPRADACAPQCVLTCVGANARALQCANPSSARSTPS